MAITKAEETFYELTGRRLNNTSMLKLFNILRDHDKEPFMNIFRSYSFESDITSDVVYYDTYEVSNNEWWDDISYKLYGTPYLWWTIALLNNVTNPFEELESGTNIKYLKEDLLYNVFKDIERLSDL